MRSRLKYLAALTASATMVAAVYFFTAIPSTAQGQATADPYGGHPNLNGIWQATTTANWDLLAAHDSSRRGAARRLPGCAGAGGSQFWHWVRPSSCRPAPALWTAMRFLTSPKPPR